VVLFSLSVQSLIFLGGERFAMFTKSQLTPTNRYGGSHAVHLLCNRGASYALIKRLPHGRGLSSRPGLTLSHNQDLSRLALNMVDSRLDRRPAASTNVSRDFRYAHAGAAQLDSCLVFCFRPPGPFASLTAPLQKCGGSEIAIRRS
jgi:hypothetical protein